MTASFPADRTTRRGAAPGTITRRLIVVLGTSQLVCWGISFYLIGVFGEPITRAFGWSMTVTFSGFSAALVVMGLASGAVGRLIDRHGAVA